MKTWKEGMEVQSTGDLVSKVNTVNDMELGLDEVDLAEVDRELERQEKEANEKYENFDSEVTLSKEQDPTVPEGWKTTTGKQDQNTCDKVLDGGDKLRPMNDNKTTPTTDIEDEDKLKETRRLEESDSEGSKRMEMKFDKLRQKWTGTDYEIICERLEGMLDWINEDGGNEVKESLIDWLIENDEATLVEESEDIVDGLEMMELEGEISRKLLLDSTELITLMIARNLCPRTMPTTFLKAGNSDQHKVEVDRSQMSGKGRLERMTKMREMLTKSKDSRKPVNSREVRDEDFPELEFKYVSRRESSRRMESVGALSSQVDNDLIQDRSTKLQIVGSDVAALYPSLDAVEVARIVYQAIMETEVKFAGIDYMEACRLIALTSTEQECRLSKLKRILPIRRSKNGTRPGITGEDPMGPEVGSQDQWKFPPLPNGLTSLEKKMVLATVMQKNVLALFKTHTYSFSGKFFLQIKGGPIGLRSTCCVAKMIMIWWDQKFLEVVKKNNLQIIDSARYMDDVRVWLRAIRLGWRWLDGQLVYRNS